MTETELSGRRLRMRLVSVFKTRPFEETLSEVMAYPARRVVNPLFSLLNNGNEIVRWRAVSAMGAVVSNLADQDLESARVIMRRFMWTLNDESGGIGWGSPESMGEIMARSAPLAAEFSAILVSYVMPEGNFLEHEGLQAGLLWGLGRLAEARPETIKQAASLLIPFLDADVPALRGLAARAALALGLPPDHPSLVKLARDREPVRLYRNGRLQTVTVAALAAKEAC